MARSDILVLLLSMILLVVKLTAKERIFYTDVERINITYYNPLFYTFVNVSARRFGRRDPIHYVHAHVETLVAFGNNVTVDVFIYEFLSNEYRRSFVEMHYKLCDLIRHDELLAPFIPKALPKTCPLPKGVYHLVNMSIPDLPLLKTFPFTKGRVFVNATLGARRVRVNEGYGDFVIKQRWR